MTTFEIPTEIHECRTSSDFSIQNYNQNMMSDRQTSMYKFQGMLLIYFSYLHVYCMFITLWIKKIIEIGKEIPFSQCCIGKWKKNKTVLRRSITPPKRIACVQLHKVIDLFARVSKWWADIWMQGLWLFLTCWGVTQISNLFLLEMISVHPC